MPQHIDTLEEMANNQLVAMAGSSDFGMLSPFAAIVLFHLVKAARTLGGIYESKHQHAFRNLLRCLAKQWRLARELIPWIGASKSYKVCLRTFVGICLRLLEQNESG
jgi:hypothetical protein